MYAHSLKRRSHTHTAHPTDAHTLTKRSIVDPTPLHTYTSITLTIPPNHVPIPPSHIKANASVHALNGNGPPVTRSQPIPPNPRSPDPIPNPPRPLKTPRTTPLPQFPGSSIAHLRNQDRTPPLVRPHPPAVTPITTHPTPNPHTRTLTHPQHTVAQLITPPHPPPPPRLYVPTLTQPPPGKLPTDVISITRIHAAPTTPHMPPLATYAPTRP